MKDSKSFRYKVTIVGFLALNTSFSGGQEVKTRGIYSHFCSVFGTENVNYVDTLGWKRHPISFFFSFWRSAKKSKNIVICPSHNGIRVLGPLLPMFVSLKKQAIFYAVIGGWLPSLLSTKHRLLKKLGKYNQIFVETYCMKNDLERLGMCNVSILRNSKEIVPVDLHALSPLHSPIRVCTFSRVDKMKGIEDAIKSIKLANSRLGLSAFCLTIFGQIESDYAERFSCICHDFPNEINYGGAIVPLESVEKLKDYDVLLFPTHYLTEGFPGTIVDAYASGLIVLASRISSIQELLVEGKQGYTFKVGEVDEIVSCLCTIFSNPQNSNLMKMNSRSSFDDFTFDKVFSVLDGWLL